MPVKPFSLKDAPSFIERAFPAQRVSIEAQTERKANAGQTLTALGSYWKGRKPLVLVRACVLGSLLPATEKAEKDLEIFELLMAMDDDAFVHRVKAVSREDVAEFGGDLADKLLDGNGKWKVKGEQRKVLLGRVLARMPYATRLHKRSLRPEEVPGSAYDSIWDRVNAHLGTSAKSHAELVEQLGIMRFGHRPRVADTFSGGGSIPFEAARIGCDSYASDLNPIACMLTWGALNIVGASPSQRQLIDEARRKVIGEVENTITKLKIEHDSNGNRAKAYLYCVETRCPETGWMIPLAGSWVISRNKRCVARLVPNREQKRFEIEIVNEASDAQIEAATQGTVQDGKLVYTLDGHPHSTPISSIRGDRKVGGETVNDLRQWEIEDYAPREGDIFQERLYCVQWFRGETDEFFFASVTDEDLKREQIVQALVRKNIRQWQQEGLVPDMQIQAGSETARLLRERGWTHWHHLFTPRNLVAIALYKQAIAHLIPDPICAGALAFDVNALADKSARLSRWEVGYPGREGVAPSADAVKSVFYNMALNTLVNYANRSFFHLQQSLQDTEIKSFPFRPEVVRTIVTHPSAAVLQDSELFITDPPYADAVSYDEITEFFIAWQRRAPVAPFVNWVWDSRRELAIRGSGDEFRREMVKAYGAMTQHMPDNGMQIVMFTHQSGSVWADMAGIFWGAGLQVTAAWYVATETASEIRSGGYVQGTVILILRKRKSALTGFLEEIVHEIRAEVAKQIETLVGLNQVTRAGRDDNLFNDADLQMAGYAAALRVLTSYTNIDGTDMTKEALRPRSEGAGVIDKVIDYAAQVANEYMVPEGFDVGGWERLNGSERFYLRMLGMEATGVAKLDNYQNFAKAFKVADYTPLMGNMRPNESRLKSAAEFKAGDFAGSEFGTSTLRAVLFALHELQAEVEADVVHSHLRDNVPGYLRKRDDIVMIASYLDARLARRRPEEAAAARVLSGLVRNEKVGG